MYKKILVWNLIFTLVVMPHFALALTGLIGSDNEHDLYKFDVDYISDLTEDIYEHDSDDYDSYDKKDFIRDCNQMYDEIAENLDKAEKVDTPKYADVKSLDFDIDTHDLIIKMFAEVDLDGELMTGAIWSEKHAYIFAVSTDLGYFAGIGADEIEDLEFDEKDIILEEISENFNDETYVKAIIMFFDDDDNVRIDLFDNSFNSSLIYWFIWFVIILVAVVVVIILIAKYRGN